MRSTPSTNQWTKKNLKKQQLMAALSVVPNANGMATRSSAPRMEVRRSRTTRTDGFEEEQEEDSKEDSKEDSYEDSQEASARGDGKDPHERGQTRS